jgi:hypothetical protein
VYTWALGLFSYGAFFVALVSRNCWALVLWCFVAAALALGWFASYFSLLIAVEGPAYCVLLACLLWLARRRSQRADGAAEAVEVRP